MDLVATLRSKISVLPNGPYTSGLKAVLLHIETAFGHLTRGQNAGEDTAFTDAVYRCNQAFEGSIKEAYRVLTGQDPDRKRPHEIEKYLEDHNVFRSRVLKQFTTYRTEWRNPSTHDHKLDFDESESFLAIVSVTAFACLLLDEIAEQLSFLEAQKEAEAQKGAHISHIAATRRTGALDSTVELLREFCRSQTVAPSSSPRQSEIQLLGALRGFISSIAPDLMVEAEPRLNKDRPYRVDLLVSRGNEKVIVELKRRFARQYINNVIAQVEHYMLVGMAKNGVLLFVPSQPSEMHVKEFAVPGISGRLAVLTPEAI